jgi:single-strand DNA-binding protein
MNILQIAGHLARDPEKRFTASGQQVTTFTVGVNYRKGGKEESTMWIRVTVWGDRFDKLISYLKKGSAVIVVGEMHPPAMYTDKEGRQQISLEMTADMVKFSPFGKPERSGEEGGASQASAYSSNQNHSSPQNHSSAGYQESGYAQASSNHGRAGGNTFGQQASPAANNDDDLPF